MQTLKFLGRGSAFNVKEGNTSAYIKQKGELLLIDCGESIFERIINNKLLDDVENVNVLITHLNSDHVGSLSSLIYYCYYIKKIRVNVFYSNEELFDLLELMGNKKDNHYNFNLLSVSEDNYIKSGIVENIISLYANHVVNMKCYSYVLFLKNERAIYYSGDCSNFSDIASEGDWIDEFYQDTSLVDYEGNVHLSLAKLYEEADERYRNKVYCMHIDDNKLVEMAKSKGFNVVEIEQNQKQKDVLK